MEHLRVFHDVARALTASLELEEILGAIMDKMANFFGPERWSMLLVDEAAQDLYYAIAVGENAESLKGLRVPLGEGVAGWVAATGNPLVVPDVALDPHWSVVYEGAPGVEYPVDRMRSGAIGGEDARRDPTAEQQAGSAERVFDLVSADPVRLRGDRDPERAVDDADPGADDHGRLHAACSMRGTCTRCWMVR